MPLLSISNDLSSSLSFSADAVQDASRRVVHQYFCSSLTSLVNGEIVSTLVAQEREEKGVVHVNSLLFEIVGTNNVVLVVLRNSDTVDTIKLENHLSLDNGSVRLAPAELVEQVCGFPPGSVPPIGHFPAKLQTVVDESLLQVETLWGGGGHPEYACLLDTEALLNLNHVEMASIAVSDSESIDEVGDSNDERLEERISKPFFPIAPPPPENHNGSTELQSEPITIVGRITGVRQMAKRLVFADFAPPDFSLLAQSNNNEDYPWRNASDGKEMAVQLVAGKTLCEALGDVAGPAAIRRIKRGQLLLIKGRTNMTNRDSVRNWVDKRSLDIVVASYQLLEEGIPPINKNQVALTSVVKSSTGSRQAPLSPPSPPSRPKERSSLYLTLNDVFPNNDGRKHVTIVDDMESVGDFADKISQLLLSLTTSNKNNFIAPSEGGDVEPVPVGLIGMDCEWRPSFLAASPVEPQPILLLQISIHPLQQVFLFDAQTIFRPLQDEKEPMTELEAAASSTLLDVFSSERLLKVGFQLGQDLRRLAASYPHIPAFRLVTAVVEVATIVKKTLQIKRERNSKYHTASLSRVTEFLLGKAINKEQQVSDWALRPLTQEQIEYAALDAAVSPLLFEKSLAYAEASVVTENTSSPPSPTRLEIARWEDDTMFTGSIQSWRFLLLDKNDPGPIRKLKAKQIVGDPYVVTQRWHTGAKSPMKPFVPRSKGGEVPYTDVNGVFRMPSKLVRIAAGRETTTVVGSIVGERVGRSKEKCIDSLLTGEAALPDKAEIEFHQRSGYVEFADGVALFVNMPDKAYKRGYPNEWLEDGKLLTWYLRKNEWKEGTSTLAKKLLQSERGIDEQSYVCVLFVRMAKGVFLCCGRCEASATDVEEPCDETANGIPKVGDWGLVKVHLRLLDLEKLQGSPDFVTMVNNWLQNADSGNGGSKIESDSVDTLAGMVLAGDVVGALGLALKEAKVPRQERSLQKGMQTLRIELSKDPNNESAIKALKNLECDD